MKASELKGYNVVGVKGDAGTYQVITIDVYDQKVKLNYPRNNWHPESKLKGIPLTEEWLVKLGFDKSRGGSVWLMNIQYVNSDFPASIQFTNNNTAMQICRSGIGAACAPCKFVHQLQNLYYALTGEELKIEQ